MSRTVAISIGNFDGVHRGHVALMEGGRSAVGPDGRVIVVTFDPHPISVLRPQETPGRLTTPDQRGELLRAAGADEVIVVYPTPELLNEEPELFVRQMVERYDPAFFVEGSNFRFGRRRSGSVRTLQALEGSLGFRTLVIDPVEAALADQHIVCVSSTMVRWVIEHGRVEDAATLLGRPYELVGPVVEGDQRGRELGVPTANLDPGDLLLPADGIYIGRAILPDGTSYPAAVSVGTKPTFGDHPRTCETHLIGFDGPLDEYGWTIRVQFTFWLRDQIGFSDVNLLREQLARDLDCARERCPAGA